MEQTNFTAYDTEDLRQKDRDHVIYPWTDFATFAKQAPALMTEPAAVQCYNSDGVT